MSPKKITDADKLEITRLYRQSGDTTASLAIRYGVSNSTISRLLKTSIPETEYEILIQQKRVVKVDVGAEILAVKDESIEPIIVVPPALPLASAISDQIEQPLLSTTDLPIPPLPVSSAEDPNPSRRLRRRSSAPLSTDDLEPVVENLADFDEPIVIPAVEIIDFATDSSKPSLPQSVSRTPVLREILADSENRYFTPVVPTPSTEEIIEDDEDVNTEDVSLLAAMFGEEIADGEDDEDFTEEDDDDDESTSSYQQLNPDKLLTEDRLHVQITPLSQATLPRTCYIVIDKFAELIVRPLKDFADLGQISGEEIQQRTLPIFDNHRVAKRFSNQRTQRVIKVPDSRVFQKTTQHLKLKGITRLLVDGNIYSLN
jgi:hypothetical protein